MKNKKKISASEQRTLWGSRVVIWITMIVVLFPVIWIVMSSFSAGDSFFLSSLFPEKFSIEHYVELFRETDFGIWVFNSLKFCFIVAIIQLVLTCSVCVCKTAVCGKKIWADGTFDITGVSKQHGSCRILYFNL